MSPHERSESERPDPETLLRRIQAEARAAQRGQLKIFLGYASGVGKSFKLFDEGRRRRARGQDVVIGAMQPQIGEDVAEIVRGLEVIPTKTVAGVPVVDVPAILKRHPGVCLIDGLAYDNPPGSRNRKRYEDVQEVVDHGISVLASINLEYIEEQQEFVKTITGHVPADAVPQSFIVAADEVVVVDAPPETVLSERGEEGVTLRARLAQQLSQLRERALLLTADVVDRQLESFLELHGIESFVGNPGAHSGLHDAQGRRDRHARQRPPERRSLPWRAVRDLRQPAEPDAARSRRQRTKYQGGARRTRSCGCLGRKDPVATILEYAREHGVTQLFVGHNLRRDWRARLRGSPLDRLIDGAEGMDVRVFPHRT